MIFRTANHSTLRTFTLLMAFLATLSLVACAADHIPSNNQKRHSTPSSSTQTKKQESPRRPNPFPSEPEPKRTWLSNFLDLGEAFVRTKRSGRTKWEENLGPGPGYRASLAAWKRKERAKRRQAKRQAAQSGTSSASGTSTTTGTATASAGQPTSTSNSTAPVWILEDLYQGEDFFPYFTFYTYGDPTHGLVNYVSREDAYNKGLAYVRSSDNMIIMKADNTTVLQSGQNRDSVRIQTNKTYTGGLFILDIQRGPYGCGVWPAFWTSNSNWPNDGEIDIYEGVHRSTNNQMTWHTNPGCMIDNTTHSFTGTANTTNCDVYVNNNEGCAITDTSYSSSGATLQNIGGGVFVMKWDPTGISVWFFPRAVIPDDILDLNPDPSGWGKPTAHLSPDDCNIAQYFQAHNIIFNITFCGDWAGQTYLTSGCPGTCNDNIMDPSNFDNSIWEIHSLRIYSNSELQAGVLNEGSSWRSDRSGMLWKLGAVLVVTFVVTFGGFF